MPAMLQTTLMLICSNVFMTFARYAQLKDMSGRPWFLAAPVSWVVAIADRLWAATCICAAVSFVFRGS